MLQCVLAEKPVQRLALDLAARCHFLQTNPVEGWGKAQQARNLGYTATYDDATSANVSNRVIRRHKERLSLKPRASLLTVKWVVPLPGLEPGHTV